MRPLLYGNGLLRKAMDRIRESSDYDLDNVEGEYIGRLDALQCEVTEERNGEFELYMRYPGSGQYVTQILPGVFIKALIFRGFNGNIASSYTRYFDKKMSWQYFRVYKIRRVEEELEVYAHHISYELSWWPVVPRTGTSLNNALISQALDFLKENAGKYTSKYPDYYYTLPPFKLTYATGFDVTQQHTVTIDEPASLKSYLGGREGSILDLYGGEWEWDNLTAKIHKARGRDDGAMIVHGFNMEGFDYDADADDTYTGAVGFVKMTDGTIVYANYPPYLTESSASDMYSPSSRWAVLDFSDDYAEATTPPEEVAIREKVRKYITNNLTSSARVSLKSNYVIDTRTQMSRGEERGISPEFISLCDTVYVVFKDYNLNIKLEVVKVTYDVLAERNIQIELNQPRATLADTIASLQNGMGTMTKYKTAATANAAMAQAAKIMLQGEEDEEEENSEEVEP